MRRVMFGLCVVCALFFAWQVAGRLSSDAVGMALGLAFGVLAGLPAAALVMLAGRRGDRGDRSAGGEVLRSGQPGAASHYGLPQAPVVVLALPQVGAGGQPVGFAAKQPEAPPVWALPGPVAAPGQRTFRIVGESDQSLDEW